MASAIKAISQKKGHDPKGHILNAFGGAGPQHACQIADLLNIKNIYINRHCGVLSALGMLLAPIVKEL